MGSGLINWSEIESAKVKILQSQVLPRSFFKGHTVEVAQKILGKVVLVDSPQGICAGRIIETEAYRGNDPASHSARGPTPRSALMFGEPGLAYVYLIYGMYRMLNFVTEPSGSAGAVLIRALEPLFGFELMSSRRVGVPERAWTQGPGRLTQALGIEMSDHGVSLAGPRIFVCEDEYSSPPIYQSGRVGIRVAQEVEWRFFFKDHPGVSAVAENLNSRPLPCSAP